MNRRAVFYAAGVGRVVRHLDAGCEGSRRHGASCDPRRAALLRCRHRHRSAEARTGLASPRVRGKLLCLVRSCRGWQARSWRAAWPVPLLLMAGLARTGAAESSLLLTLEGAATALMAWFVFHENFDRRVAAGMAFLVAGAAVLAWSGAPSFRQPHGSARDRRRVSCMGS